MFDPQALLLDTIKKIHLYTCYGHCHKTKTTPPTVAEMVEWETNLIQAFNELVRPVEYKPQDVLSALTALSTSQKQFMHPSLN